MTKIARFNLFYFDDEEAEDFSDVDAQIAAFDEEWSDDEEETVVDEDENVETEESEEDLDEEEELQESAESEETEEDAPSKEEFPEEKQNRAFADMRRQLEEEKKYANVIRQVAKQNGMSEEDVVKQFETKQLEKEASEQNVPVEVLQRMKQLENETNTLKTQSMKDKFNASVEEVKEKFNLEEEDVSKVFDQYRQNGWDPQTINFEQAYKLANFDAIVDKKLNDERQKELETKRKRKNGATVPNGKGAKPDTSTELTDEKHMQMLKDMGLDDQL